MQDRYAGDVGDFLKIGLLRWLVAAQGDEPGLRLGVVWYLVVDESHNADGKHVAYLQPGHRSATRFSALDPDLYGRLTGVVRSGARSVVALERSGVLPTSTRTFNCPLRLDHLPRADRTARLERRSRWVIDALAATQDCDLVFVDPDNGVRRADHPAPRHRNKSVKHAYLDELRPFAARGQSLVAYHHADRSAPTVEQARRRMAELAVGVGVEPIAAVQASAGTVRLFLIVPGSAHADRLTARLRALEASRWSAELRVHWFHRPGRS